MDLANAFGSVPHGLIWSAFDNFRVPGVVVNLVKKYFQDIRPGLSLAGFYNRLGEARDRYHGRVYDFPISIYNGDGSSY